MQVYIDIVNTLKGDEKIEKFLEIVEYLDLRGDKIYKFAIACGFPTTEQVRQKEVNNER